MAQGLQWKVNALQRLHSIGFVPFETFLLYHGILVISLTGAFCMQNIYYIYIYIWKFLLIVINLYLIATLKFQLICDVLFREQ